MAFVDMGYVVTFGLKDVGNGVTTRSYRADPGVNTEALAVAAATALRTDVAAVTKLNIISYSISHEFVEDTVGAPIDESAELENRAIVTVPIAGIPNKNATFDIPAPVNAIMGAAGTGGFNEVDMADPLLDAFLTNFRNVLNTTTHTGEWTISDGEHIAASGGAGVRKHKTVRKG